MTLPAVLLLCAAIALVVAYAMLQQLASALSWPTARPASVMPAAATQEPVSEYAVGLLKEATAWTDAGACLRAAGMVVGALLTLSVPARLVNR